MIIHTSLIILPYISLSLVFNHPYNIIMKKLVTTILIGMIAWSCQKESKPNSEEALVTQEGVSLNISYEVPGDLPSSDASEADLARFAWNEFFALNWAASWNVDNQQRGTPDTSWEFATGGVAPALSVWETYIHRTELRPADGNRYKDLSTGMPNYTFIDPVDTSTNNVDLNDFWVNLDEDNEIGSCYLFAYDSFEVLYMAKSNLVEYNYIRNNFPTDTDLKAALNNGKGMSYLKKITNEGSSCNSDTAKNVICLPCGNASGQGSIEIKTAWRFLDPAKDDESRFLIKKGVYYTKASENAEPVAQIGNFGLIGMHIIHKTENYPAFVFASWEQLDVRSAKMKTIGLDTPLVDGKPDPNVDPHSLTPVIDRAIPATLQEINKEAQELITSQNSASVWQYYQLIGVQGKPINYEDRSTDDNYFMANYVIESDSLLTFFHGSFADPFDSTIQNVVYEGKSFNMGGCQGCHGQAQIGGTDFSFLLDFGAGKPVPEPDPLQSLEMALEAANPTGLKSIIEAYSKTN